MRELTRKKVEIIAALVTGGCSLEEAGKMVGVGAKQASRLLHSDAGKQVCKELRVRNTDAIIAQRIFEITAPEDALSTMSVMDVYTATLRAIKEDAICPRLRRKHL